MKKNILFAFCLMAAKAQNISVKSFELLPNDLTAITNGTMETDQNGEVAALIKVITSEKGFLFDGGMMGIVKVVQKVGEIWVYVPHGLNHISISHQQLGKLRDYYFPVAIEKARTYELVLTTAKIKTTLEEDAGGGYVAFDISPADATVYIDDMTLTPNEDGSLSVFLTYGPHEYRVEAAGYKPASGQVEVSSEETQPLEITLRSVMATVTLTTDMAEAEIWANNKLLGKGSWTGGLPAGTYAIETRRDGHRPRSTTASFAEKAVKTITLEAPVPVYGRLRAESKPSGAEVVIDGKVIGKTPGIFDNILFGTRTPLFRKEGYADTTAVVTIEEGKIATASVEMRKAEKKDIQETGEITNKTLSRKSTDYYPSKSIYFDATAQYYWGLSYGGNIGLRSNGFNVRFDFRILREGERGLPYHANAKPLHQTLQYYYAGSFLNINLGYDVLFHNEQLYDWLPFVNRLCLTPSVGLETLFFYDRKSSSYGFPAFSSHVSLRFEYPLSPHVHIYATPLYNIPLFLIKTSRFSSEASWDYVKEQFYKFHKEGECFGGQLGISVVFGLKN